ncbi:MAG: hypothetical protein AAB847_02155 [Patescibacteria group bacterium]
MRPLNILVAFFGVIILVIGGLVVVANYSQSVPKVAQKIENEELEIKNKEDEQLPEISFNITKDLANEISKDILVRNPDGPKKLNNEKWIDVANPEQMADLLTEEGLKNFNPKDFQPEIKLTDLRISSPPTGEPSAVAAEIYFRTFRDILKHDFENARVDLSSSNLTGIETVIAAYDRAIKNFYNLETPEKLTDIQKKQISLLTGQKKVFEVLANYQNDPVQAYLAAQVFGELMNGAENLNSEITVFIKTNNLNI